MRRPSMLAWVALVLAGYGATAAAQDSTAMSGAARAEPDSAAAGRAAGIAEARHHHFGGYFAAGVLNGIAIGAAGPVAFNETKPDVPPMVVTGAGVAGLVGVSLYGARAGVTLPRTEEAQLQPHGARYQQAFRDAYTTQVRSRRKKAALWGGVTGAAVGVGTLLWLVVHSDT